MLNAVKLASQSGADEMLARIDSFDPTTWLDEHEHRIYLDVTLVTYAIVDDIDYWHFSRWCWQLGKISPKCHGKKRYAARSQSWGGNYRPKLYLHIEIMKRTGIAQPTPEHRLVHHINGNELDCRRSNLQWATTKTNHVGAGKRDNRTGRFVKC